MIFLRGWVIRMWVGSGVDIISEWYFCILGIRLKLICWFCLLSWGGIYEGVEVKGVLGGGG